jgi:uncharacterized protein YhdP
MDRDFRVRGASGSEGRLVIRRSTKICLEVLGALVAGTIVLCGLAAWRLSSAPVRVDFLAPYLEAALASNAEGLDVSVGETVVVWSGWTANPDIRATNVRIRDDQGTTIAMLPNTLVKLSLRALLRGIVAPTQIEVRGAEIRLVRDSDGSIQFGLAAPGPPGSAGDGAADGTDEVAAALIEDLPGTPDPGEPLGYLSTLRLLDGRFRVDDRQLGLSWQAPSADLVLGREPGGLSGRMVTRLSLGERSMGLDAGFVYRQDAGAIDVSLEFDGLWPDEVAKAVPELRQIADLDLALSGALSATIDDNGSLRGGRLEVHGADGSLTLPSRPGVLLPIKSLAAEVELGSGFSSITVKSGKLQFGDADTPGPAVDLLGNLTGLGGDADIAVEVKVADLPVDLFDLYWPVNVGVNPRRWVTENIHDGSVDRATMHLLARMPGSDPDAIEITQIAGTLSYTGLTAYYLKPLPPMVGVDGTATFDDESFRLATTTGSVLDIQLGKGRIDMVGLDTSDHRIDIAMPIRGPLASIFEVLDHDRLRLIQKLGITRQGAAGDVDAELYWAFPLLNDLEFDQVAVRAKGKLAGVRLPDAILGFDATNGDLDLALSQDDMRVTGTMRVLDTPVVLDWNEDFVGDKNLRARIHVSSAPLTSEQRAELGFDLRPYLDGLAATSVVLSRYRNGHSTVDVTLDLQDAALDAPFLHWSKPPGQSGTARLTVNLDGTRMTDLQDVEIQAADLRLRGAVRFDDGQKGVTRLDLDQLSFGRNRLRDVMVRVGARPLQIVIGGGVLDAEPLLFGEEGKSADGKPAPVNITVRHLDKMYLRKDRSLDEVTAQLVRTSDGWERIEARAMLSPEQRTIARPASKDAPADLKLYFGPAEDGRHMLDVRSSDAGGVLKAFDLFDTVRGGKLTIKGVGDGAWGRSPLKGKIEIEDYRLIDAPIMAKILTIASLTGIVEVLSGQGLAFHRCVGDFVIRDGRVETDLVRAYGSSLGITAKGSVDLESHQADLQGTVVPAYSINRILGEIPVLGFLLTGGEGEGLFAATYRVRGNLKDPQVSVNPLAALAPGFLRGLFDIFDGGGGDSEPRATAVPNDLGR